MVYFKFDQRKHSIKGERIMTNTEIKTLLGQASDAAQALLRAEKEVEQQHSSSESDSESENGNPDQQPSPETMEQCTRLLESILKLREVEESQFTRDKENDENQSKNSNINTMSFIRTSLPSYNNKQVDTMSKAAANDVKRSTHIRELLSLNTLDATNLIAVLSNAIAYRYLNTAPLLTQEILVNQSQLQSNTSSVTISSLRAARTYLELILCRGAWGIGVVNVGALSALEALVRRWGEECRGREMMMVHQKRHSKHNESVCSMESQTSKRKMSGGYPDKKRGRSSFVPSESSSDDENKECQWMREGIQLSISIAKVLRCDEFFNWSKDAQDSLLESTLSAFTTLTALSASLTFERHTNSQLKNQIVNEQSSNGHLSHHSILSLARSIERVVLTEIKKRSLDTTTLGQREGDPTKSTFLTIMLRLVYPLLTHQVDVPNGVNGKCASFSYSVSLLRNIICSFVKISQQSSESHDITPGNTNRRTPNRCVSMSTPKINPKTPRSSLKKRRSSLANITTPSLKKTISPKRSRRKSLRSYPTNRPFEKVCPPALNIIIGFLQRLSTSQRMEQREVRSRISKVLKECLDVLPGQQQCIFVSFLVQLCRSKVSSHRIFGVELLGELLLKEWVWSDRNKVNISPESESKSGKSLRGTDDLTNSSASRYSLSDLILSTFNGRISDRAPAVRARVAHSLSIVLKTIQTLTDHHFKSKMIESIGNRCYVLIASFRDRAMSDEKAIVRKAAITSWFELLLFSALCTHEDTSGAGQVTEEDIFRLCQLCGDSSVSVRTTAAWAIFSLLECQHSKGSYNTGVLKMLEMAWTDSVLPLVLDIESTCVSKAVNMFFALVIGPIIEVGNQNDPTPFEANNIERKYKSSFNILSRISQSSSDIGASKCLKRALKAALTKVFEQSKSSNELYITILQEVCRLIHNAFEKNCHVVDDEHYFTGDISIGVWCLLESIATLASLKQHCERVELGKAAKQSGLDGKFLSFCWGETYNLCRNETRNENVVNTTTSSCLCVITELAHVMTNREAKEMASKLKSVLIDFQLDSIFIGRLISALVALTEQAHSGSSRQIIEDASSEWVLDIFDQCEIDLNSFITPEDDHVKELASWKLERIVFTIGELRMVGFSNNQDINNNSKPDEFTSHVLNVKPSTHLVYLTQALLPPRLPADSSRRVIADSVRAHAFIALGKLCLRDETLAKDCLNLFAQELRSRNSNSTIKSNALLVLGDFCVRYTNLTDKFLPLMASCLHLEHTEYTDLAKQKSSDSMPSIVRQHAILILSNLLLQDYMKWKGLLFYRLLATTVDDDVTVANLAHLILCGPLLSKQPSLFFNNFVDAIFVLNGCTVFSTHKVNYHDDSEAKITNDLALEHSISLKIKAREKRFQIYSMLLEHSTDEEKIGTSARIAKKVLAVAIRQSGDLRSACSTLQHEKTSPSLLSAYSVISDSFAILSDKKLCMNKSTGLNDDLNLSSSITESSSRLSSVKSHLLSKISRKHLIESVVPILCKLKPILERSRSPLLKDLMNYFVYIFRQFKREINETLATNPTLLQEIIYDTKKFEKELRDEGNISYDHSREVSN